MKRRTRTWHIYGCPVPAHFFLNGHVNHHHVVQLICYYMLMYCFMYYDTHTTYSHNIFAWTLPSLGQILTCRRCGCFSKFFLLIAFFLCFPSLLVASRNIWVRETSDMCTLHLPFPPQPRIPVANKDWFIIGIPFTKKTCYNPNYDCYWVGVGPQCAPNLHTWICYAGKSTLVEQSSMIFQFIRNDSKMTWLRNVDQPKKLEFFEMHVWFDGIAQPGRRHPPPPPTKKKYFEHWFL